MRDLGLSLLPVGRIPGMEGSLVASAFPLKIRPLLTVNWSWKSKKMKNQPSKYSPTPVVSSNESPYKEII